MKKKPSRFDKLITNKEIKIYFHFSELKVYVISETFIKKMDA